jgi:hypothetical protein
MAIGVAFRSFFKALFNADFSRQVEGLLKPALPEPPKPNGDLVRLLGILQRDGRLVDFLMEEIDGYPDDQLGAAVRDIHRNCRGALTKYLELGPILKEEEGKKTVVSEGFDGRRIRLTGKVTGGAPYKGEVAHRGWLVTELKIPESAGADPLVLAPAEVEIP